MSCHCNNRFSAFAATLLAGAIAVAPAHADDASCKPVTDATVKAAHIAYHEKVVAGGRSYEKIYTTTALYVGSNGHWARMPASPQTLLDAMRESGAVFTACRVMRSDTFDGKPATVYAAHEHLASSGENDDSQFWIGSSSGLPLKSESDSQVGGRKLHVSTQFSYDNVQAPAGAH